MSDVLLLRMTGASVDSVLPPAAAAARNTDLIRISGVGVEYEMHRLASGGVDVLLFWESVH